MSSQSQYDRLQVCMNGHVITDLATNPLYRKDYCSECGSPTILDCPECGTPMRGALIIPGVIGGYTPTPAPAYCHGCGRAFPWTGARLEAAHELAQELENLDELSGNNSTSHLMISLQIRLKLRYQPEGSNG